MIIEIQKKGIIHNCNTDSGSSGSPIISLDSNKVIGIHCGNCKKESFNFGILIKFVINSFQSTFKKLKTTKKYEKRNINNIKNSPISKNKPNKIIKVEVYSSLISFFLIKSKKLFFEIYNKKLIKKEL